MWNDSPSRREQHLLHDVYLRVAVLVLALALVVSATAERVTFKILVDRLEGYRYFIMQLVVLANLAVHFVTMLYKMLRTDAMSQETYDVSKWNFALMGLLDCLALLLTIVPGGRVPAPVTVVLVQVLTPCNHVVGVLFRSFRSKYSAVHYGGSVLILAGGVVSILPLLTSDALGTHNTEALWNCMMLACAAIPAALSLHFKETVVVKQQLDPSYLGFWSSLFQLIIGVVVAPLALAMQRVTSTSAWHNTGWHLLGTNWSQGCKCIFAGGGTTSNDFCWLGIVILVVYIASSFAVNFAFVSLAPKLSLRYLHYTFALSIPLALVCLEWYSASSVVARMNGAWPKWHMTDFGGAILVFVGALVFHFKEEPGSQAETPLPHMPGDSGHKGGKHHGKSGSSGGAASSSTSSSDSDGVSP